MALRALLISLSCHLPLDDSTISFFNRLIMLRSEYLISFYKASNLTFKNVCYYLALKPAKIKQQELMQFITNRSIHRELKKKEG